MITKTTAKKILGEMPLTAEAYWYLRQGGRAPRTGFKLDKLQANLPGMVEEAAEAADGKPPGKRILIFCTLHFWIAHGAVLGLALAGEGHAVTLAYLPYSNTNETINKFDLRRQNIYAQNVLADAAPLMEVKSFLDFGSSSQELPWKVQERIREVALRDTQYIMQVESIPDESPLYELRLERNMAAAAAAYSWINQNEPDLLIIPNGSILEFGSVYQIAEYLSIPVTTYEFGEQRNRIWLAQNKEVMRQQTDELWAAHGGRGLSEAEYAEIRTLMSTRQKADLWGNFSRRWQGIASVGGDLVRQSLNLDGRPIVLLATNVIGDSLTLGRQVFSNSMTEWLEKTVAYFAKNQHSQLVVRIHPGELVTQGPSVADVVNGKFTAGIPENIHLIPAEAEVNTYDLVEITDLGLVYTTTVGLEMAMSGVPVIVIGQTHYRNKGFTINPLSWEAYFDKLTDFVTDPNANQLKQTQVDLAWEYAYRFFFEYPHPFPWHLLHLWEDIEQKPMASVMSEDGIAEYGETLSYLAGEPIEWVK
jgi:hypothetical protein